MTTTIEYRKADSCLLRVFVNTWGNYNENGADGGEWLDLPMAADELEAKLEAIAAAMGDDDPEWAIHDHEWTTSIELGDVDEIDEISEWNERCQEVAELDDDELEVIAAAIEAWGYTFPEALERFRDWEFTFYPGYDLEQLAYELVEETFPKDGVPDVFLRYFDYEAFARDLEFDGYCEVSGGVILEG